MNREKGHASRQAGFSTILILSVVGVALAVLVVGSITPVKKFFKPPTGDQISSLESTDFEEEDEEDEDEVDELENIEID